MSEMGTPDPMGSAARDEETKQELDQRSEDSAPIIVDEAPKSTPEMIGARIPTVLNTTEDKYKDAKVGIWWNTDSVSPLDCDKGACIKLKQVEDASVGIRKSVNQIGCMGKVDIFAYGKNIEDASKEVDNQSIKCCRKRPKLSCNQMIFNGVLRWLNEEWWVDQDGHTNVEEQDVRTNILIISKEVGFFKDLISILIENYNCQIFMASRRPFQVKGVRYVWKLETLCMGGPPERAPEVSGATVPTLPNTMGEEYKDAKISIWWNTDSVQPPHCDKGDDIVFEQVEEVSSGIRNSMNQIGCMGKVDIFAYGNKIEDETKEYNNQTIKCCPKCLELTCDQMVFTGVQRWISKERCEDKDVHTIVLIISKEVDYFKELISELIKNYNCQIFMASRRPRQIEGVRYVWNINTLCTGGLPEEEHMSHDSQGPWECCICNIVVSSFKGKEDHLRGKKHRREEKRAKASETALESSTESAPNPDGNVCAEAPETALESSTESAPNPDGNVCAQASETALESSTESAPNPDGNVTTVDFPKKNIEI